MWGDQPPGRGEGVKPVGQNDQVLQKTVFYGSPYHYIKLQCLASRPVCSDSRWLLVVQIVQFFVFSFLILIFIGPRSPGPIYVSGCL